MTNGEGLIERGKLIAERCASLAAKTPVAGEPDPDWWLRQSTLDDACDKIHEMIITLSEQAKRIEVLTGALVDIAELQAVGVTAARLGDIARAALPNPSPSHP